MPKKKVNPRRVPLTLADANRAKKDAMSKAVGDTTAIIFTALRDKHGVEVEELQAIWASVNEVSESVCKGYCTIADMKRVLLDEAGILIKD